MLQHSVTVVLWLLDLLSNHCTRVKTLDFLGIMGPTHWGGHVLPVMRSFSSFAARLCQEGSPKPSEALHVPVGKSAAFPLPPPEDERAQVPQEPRFLRHQKAYQLKQHYSIIFKYILMFCCSKTVLLFNNLPPVPPMAPYIIYKQCSTHQVSVPWP